ncbi:MAG: hypothetical protein FWC26_09905 [Fibromonadales bacterium]|nr:hypothetical protein [Fibromonadales bacterium]
MPTILQQFKVPLSQKNNIPEVIEKLTGQRVFNVRIERLALDYRSKGNPHFVCNATYNLEKIPQNTDSETLFKKYVKNNDMPHEVSIVGAGPAGLWAAYGLLLSGHKVNLYEQGKPVEERFRDIRRFLKSEIFLEHSNIFFGEGGAGAFSDGKLNTRSRTEFSQAVLGDLIKIGAPEEIAYLAKPHIGTDKLQFLIKNMRKLILELGGKIHFESCLQDISVAGNHLNSIRINNEWLPCEALVLASGHSARNIYEILSAHGVLMEGKSFAIGARIEHPQSFINESRYGSLSPLPAADYTLTGKTAYSFCMCPGGIVVPCASEPNGVATNGMSYSRHNSPFANSALVVPHSIEKSDTKSGIALQRQLENAAFEMSGKKFLAPKQSAESFLAKKGCLWDLLPSNVSCALEAALHEFEKKMPGFIKNGTLIAPETRTSSPIRIVRKENGESVSVSGIYPAGEGAGYAGGILTSAADGLRLATHQ